MLIEGFIGNEEMEKLMWDKREAKILTSSFLVMFLAARQEKISFGHYYYYYFNLCSRNYDSW